MAILSVDRHWIGTSARGEMNGARTLRMRYLVICDSIDNETDLQILEDSRIPTEGDQITVRGVTYYVNSRETEPPDETNRLKWFVTLELTDTLDGGGGDLDQPPGSNNPNPTDDPPYWEFDSGDGTRFINRDIDGKLITNSAGDPPDPISIFTPRPLVTFNRNEASFTWATHRKYTGKVNEAIWNGAPKDTVLMRKIRAVQRWRNRIPFFACSYQFEFLDLDWGWQHRLASIGLRELKLDTSGGASTKKLTPIYVNGEPTQEPMPLDQFGNVIPADLIRQGTQPFEETWIVMKRADFGPLNIILPS